MDKILLTEFLDTHPFMGEDSKGLDTLEKNISELPHCSFLLMFLTNYPTWKVINISKTMRII